MDEEKYQQIWDYINRRRPV